MPIELTLTTPALLFPAISLLLLAPVVAAETKKYINEP